MSACNIPLRKAPQSRSMVGSARQSRARILFSWMDRSPGKHRIDKIVVTRDPPQTLTEFIEAFAEYSSSTEDLKCYRGQRDAAWHNVAGIFRPDLKELLKNEKRAVRDLISVHPSEFAPDETMFDRLVRMQHFGLPTRLLDVSLNALVALYFATDPGPEGANSDGAVTAFAVPAEREKYFDSDAVSCLANLANMTDGEKNQIYQLREARAKGIRKEQYITDFNEEEVVKRLHQFIRGEKPYFLPIINPIDLFKPYYVHPKMSNARILAQSGAFIIYGIEPPKRIKYAHEIKETRFIVPKDNKSTIRYALENLEINESTLFPEIDKAAMRIGIVMRGCRLLRPKVPQRPDPHASCAAARRRPEDVDSDGEDHAADEVRYACMSRPWLPRRAVPPRPDRLVYEAQPDGRVVANMTIREAVELRGRRRKHDL
jgi:FRG domain